METTQLNIRMSKLLIGDIEIISKLLKVNKSDWIRSTLAKNAAEDKSRLLMELGNLYVDGILSKHDIEKIVGKDIAKKMDVLAKIAEKSVAEGAAYGKKIKTQTQRN